MPWTNVWDETKPADTDLASTLGVQGRQVKLDIRERVNREHIFGVSTTTDGEHRNITITASGIAANTSAIKVSGFSLSAANFAPIVDLAGTWNTTGLPTGIKLNVTDTASDPSSLLIDLQVGGVSKFKVSKTGVVTAAGVVIGGASGLIQTVQTLSTGVFTSDTVGTYIDATGCTVTITPTSAANRILLRFSVNGFISPGLNNLASCDMRIVRGAGTVVATFTGAVSGQSTTTIVLTTSAQVMLEALDAPATTSATTYKLQFKVNAGGAGNTARVGSGTGSTSLTAQEVL